jgi:hypothetical protein
MRSEIPYLDCRFEQKVLKHPANARVVGWVERLFCDTHHLHAPMMGIAAFETGPLHPSY